MAKTPKKKKRPLKSQRKHVPSLSADRLKITLVELQAIDASDLVKQAVGDVFKAASNPDHSRPQVIVKSLSDDRQKLISKTARRIKSIGDDTMARGKQKLLDMSQDEWDALINEQAD